MEEIANNVFIETRYPGVVLACIRSDDRLLMIDAPILAEHQQAWLNQLRMFGDITVSTQVLLDAHIDRTLSSQGMAAKVLVQDNVMEFVRGRSTSAKSQEIDPGAESAVKELPANLIWSIPEITYSEQLTIYLDQEPIVLSHQPGAHLAGSWLRYEKERVIFIGDSVVLNQPPFLAWSNLDTWLTELAWLRSGAVNGYKIIGSRNGLLRPRSIDKFNNFLLKVKEIMNDLVGSEHLEEDVMAAVITLMKKLNYNKDLSELYKNRLAWGLFHYLQRNFPAAGQNP